MMDFCYDRSNDVRFVRRAAYLKNRQIFRMKLLTLTSAIILLTPGLSSRVVDARPTLPDANCRCDVNDRFDPQAKMPQGIHQGKCINSCHQRSLRRLSAAEAAEYGIEPQAIAVANVSHQNQFWVAQILPNSVAEVIYQLENFPSPIPAAHTQLRFRFSPGSEVLLIPQIPGSHQSPVKLQDLIFSVEAVAVVGGNFDLVAGFFDNFAIAYRLVSLESRVQRMIIEDGHQVQQIQLNLTPAQKNQLLLNAITKSQQAGLTQMYNTLNRNCTTEVFRIIDQTIGYHSAPNSGSQEIFINAPTGEQISMLFANGILNQQAINQFLADSLDATQLQFLQEHIPTISPTALQRRGIKGMELPDLNYELQNTGGGGMIW
ncbi:hypothetical protein NIES39_L03290 [Arthrospira platensis NIES-39]|nr:hypothetical protein APPUASWS_030265 [Arthrospira platensis str. Paraca]BAI92486.1 hypothetical protein NIES39_L03290 [Arthrospira platensis NIES-39]